MSTTGGELRQVTMEQIPAASTTLAEAFQDDPIWRSRSQVRPHQPHLDPSATGALGVRARLGDRARSLFSDLARR
jgi:hypothetical protein